MAQLAPPEEDALRLAELRALDLAALRPVIDRVTRLARSAADAPIAYVVLVEEDHVWTSGFEGMPEKHGPLALSEAARSLKDGPVWLGDLLRSWPDHPWVAGAPHARFYCNVPIVLSNGVRLGALCVAGHEARARSERVLADLGDLAALLAGAIERLGAQRETRAAVAVRDAVMKYSPVSLGVLDRDLRYVYVNEQWTIDKGVAEADALGRTMEELFPHTYALFRETYAKALAGETQTGERIHAPIPDRPDRWLKATISPWLDAEGNVAGCISMSHDISGLVAGLERAQRSEARLKLALEIAEVSVYELDYRNRTLSLDGAADSFFDATHTYNDLARNIWVTVHPEDRAFAQAEWDRHVRDGTPFRTEYRMNVLDRDVWAFSAAELIHGEDGRIDGVLGVLNNITARKEAEAEIIKARDGAEAANRAKSEFLANMSHEIRTPLNGVMGVAAALARTELTPAQAEMVGLIETSGQTLEAILADVLDLARVEAGRLELKAETFALADCVRSAAALFQPAAAEKGLAFDLDIAPEAAGTFIGDAVRVRQIVCNLLSNAVKFTAVGRVALAARMLEDEDGSRVAITVADTGIGFADEVRSKLFERFEQADGSITRRYGGTGLGLAISRALAEAMGGSLEASSQPGLGSAFAVVLPLERATASDPVEAPRAADRPTPERAPRVLLAEDHAINRKVVELLLGQVGVELTCVENGAEAVEAAAGGDFDLILMDMQMPVMDGLTAIRAIRAAERAAARPATPVWALSANALPEHVEASLAAGADGHLSKPVSANALYDVLADACEKAGAEETTAAAG
jgi:PAS domain S-box-containing protein